MADNESRLVITAVDRSQQVFASIRTQLGGLATSIRGATTALAGLGAGVSVAGLTAGFKAAVDELARLDDAAEQTGSSVESISAAVNTLRANDAGGIDELIDLTSRLGRSLQNADKDTSKASEAFKKLGLNLDELKSGGRVDGIVAFSKALDQFADDGNKAVLVDAALGRGASLLIPQLNELAKTTADAATATGEQAKQAEAARKNVAAFQNQIVAFRNDLVAKVLPGLNEFLIKYRAIATLRGSPTDILDTLLGEDQTQRIAGLQRRIDELDRIREEMAKKGEPGIIARALNPALRTREDIDKELGQLQRDLQRAKGIKAEQDKLFAKAGLSAEPEAPKPSVDVGGLTGGGDVKTQLSDADKLYRKTLDQLFATQDLNAEQKAALETALDGLPKQYRGAQQAAEAAARQADILRTQADAQDRSTKALQDYVRELERAEGINLESLAKALQPDDAGWRRVAEELRKIRKVDPDTKATDAALAAANQLLEAGALTFDEYEKLGSVILGLKEPLEEVADASKDLLLPLSSSIEEAVFGFDKLSNVARAFFIDVGKIALRQQVTGPLTEYLGTLFGGKSTTGIGGDSLFGSFRKLLGFASGGFPPVGVPSIVGERGPELFVPRTAGMIVPNHMLGGAQIVQHFDMRGSMSSENMVRAAAALGAAQARASIYDDRVRGRGAFA